jgi:hypothetical protein
MTDIISPKRISQTWMLGQLPYPKMASIWLVFLKTAMFGCGISMIMALKYETMRLRVALVHVLTWWVTYFITAFAFLALQRYSQGFTLTDIDTIVPRWKIHSQRS